MMNEGSYGVIADYPGIPVPQLASKLIVAATVVQDALMKHLIPPARQMAFQSAASMVNGNGGTTPTGPSLTAFTALARAYGIPVAAFTHVVLAVQDASLHLGAALTVLHAAASAATTPAQLATALTQFETEIASCVAGVLTAAPSVSVVSPAPIKITGINQ
jgi:hypothetical protein